MKRAQTGEYDPQARRIDDVVACPQCSARAQVFEDGAVCCVAEGGLSFIPEEHDKDLYARRQKYRAMKSHTEQEI